VKIRKENKRPNNHDRATLHNRSPTFNYIATISKLQYPNRLYHDMYSSVFAEINAKWLTLWIGITFNQTLLAMLLSLF